MVGLFEFLQRSLLLLPLRRQRLSFAHVTRLVLYLNSPAGALFVSVVVTLGMAGEVGCLLYRDLQIQQVRTLDKELRPEILLGPIWRRMSQSIGMLVKKRDLNQWNR